MHKVVHDCNVLRTMKLYAIDQSYLQEKNVDVLDCPGKQFVTTESKQVNKRQKLAFLTTNLLYCFKKNSLKFFAFLF